MRYIFCVNWWCAAGFDLHNMKVANESFENGADFRYLAAMIRKIAFTKELRTDSIQGIG